jgi:polyisoprenoid-binding protein YceI
MEATTVTNPQTSTTQIMKWSLDPAHSKIQFSARHMVISTVTGQFEKFDSHVVGDVNDIEKIKAETIIQVDSISTGQPDRDNHLKSADFFDAANHPEIKFVSTSFKKKSGNEFKLSGDLTIRGITKNIDLDVEYGGMIKDPWGNDRAGFTVTGVLDRFDYDLKWNALIETGGAVVGPKIKILAEVEFVRVKEE